MEVNIINLKVSQQDNIHELEFKTIKESDDLNGIIGVVCKAVFDHDYQLRKKRTSSQFKSFLPLNVQVRFNKELLIDTELPEYDAFRKNFMFQNNGKSKKDFALALLKAVDQVQPFDTDED